MMIKKEKSAVELEPSRQFYVFRADIISNRKSKETIQLSGMLNNKKKNNENEIGYRWISLNACNKWKVHFKLFREENEDNRGTCAAAAAAAAIVHVLFSLTTVEEGECMAGIVRLEQY